MERSHSPLPQKAFGFDLARATAISLVFLIHLSSIADLNLPGSWYLSFLGVDIFFALSGFLIGEILVNLFTAEAVSFSKITTFLTRRWLRTVPLYLVMLWVNYMMSKHIFHDIESFDYRYLFFLQNLFHPLNHFFKESWSLCVEEWFYFSFSVLLFVFVKCLAKLKVSLRYKLTGFTLLYIVAFNIVRLLHFADYKELGIVVCRLDATAYGVLMSFLYHFFPVKKWKLFSLFSGVAMCLLGIFLFLFKKKTGAAYVLYYPLVGTGLAIIILHLKDRYKQGKNDTGKRLVVSTSRLAYSIYLLNIVMIQTALYFWGTQDYLKRLLLMLVTGIAVLIASNLTYRFIEKPVLRLRDKFIR